MLKVNKQKFTSIWQHKQTILVIVAALLLTLALIAVRAGQPLASFEAEGSILSGNALIKSDTAASGGKFVEFTAGSTPPPPGTILNALDNPSAFGYPDETNTGVPAGTKLTPISGTFKIRSGDILQNDAVVVKRPSSGSAKWGPFTLYPDRTELHAADLVGRIQQDSAYDMHVTSSRLTGFEGAITGHLIDTRDTTNSAHTYFTDSTLNARLMRANTFGHRITCVRCDISGGEDSIDMWWDVNFYDSYLHDTVRPDDEAHSDIFQVGGAGRSGCHHCTLTANKKLADDGSQGGVEFDDGWYDPTNAVLMIGNYGGQVHEVIIEDSLVDGGNWMFNDNWFNNGNAVPGPIIVRNNRVGRHFRFGPKALHSTHDGNFPWVWQNNVWDDTNEPLN